MYAAVEDTIADSHQLICFHESSPGNLNAPPATRHTFPIVGSRQDPVVLLESIAHGEDALSTLLVLQQSGRISGLSESLTETQWTNQLDFPTDSFESSRSSVKLEYSATLSASDASKGIFKSRTDVLANLKPTIDTENEAWKKTRVLITVSRDTTLGTWRADAFVVRPESAVSTPKAIMQHLCSWRLAEMMHAKDAKHAFDYRDGSLQTLVQSRLIVHDLRGLRPIKTSEMALSASPASLLPLASHLTAVSSKSGCEVFDIRYRAIQAVQSAVPVSGSTTALRKRKRQSAEFGVTPAKLVHFFPKAAAVVGIAGNDLISYPVTMSPRLTSKKGRGSRLIDSLDRAVGSQNPLLSEMQHEPTKSLVLYADRRDVVNFEKVFFRALSGESTEEQSQALVTKKEKKSKQLQQNQHQTLDPLGTRQGQILAQTALAAVFTKDGLATTENQPHQFGSADGLRVRFMPHNVFRWLSLWQLLTPEHISRALKPRLSSAALLSPITQEAIASAIAAADPSLAMLADVVIKGNVVSHAGLVRATRTFLRSFDTLPDLQEPSQLRLLSQMSQEDDEDVRMEAEAKAAQWELDMASIMLEDGPSGRGSALRVCCEKMAGSAAAKEVARSLREQMSRRDLSLLIELLRFELANGGWTSHVLEAEPASESDHPQDEIIWVICELLNRVLDALGTGGWIGGFSTSATAEDAADELSLIEALRADVFAVLEGVQESNFFCGFLKDFIRYKDAAQVAGKRVAGHQGEIESEWTRQEQMMLPLGLSDVQGPSKTRVGAGGEIQRRSARDIARKLEKRVPVYSFERIKI